MEIGNHYNWIVVKPVFYTCEGRKMARSFVYDRKGEMVGKLKINDVIDAL